MDQSLDVGCPQLMGIAWRGTQLQGLSWGISVPVLKGGSEQSSIAFSPSTLSVLVLTVFFAPNCAWHIIGTQEFFGE